MRIQIKSLTGPDEIMRPSETRTGYEAAPTTETGNTLFTCLLNRDVTDDDDGDFPLTVTLHIFDQQGNAMVDNEVTLTVTRDHIQNNNSFRFTLNIPSVALGGSHIYVHAVRENADGQNVSYNTSSYHETIKKVYIYAQKRFLRVYWSENEQISETNPEPDEDEDAAEPDTNATTVAEATAEQDTDAAPVAEETPEGDQEQPAANANAAQQNQDIPAEMNTQEEGLITTRAGNEDAFIHIKAQGMYSERTGLVITSEDNTFLFRSPITLKRNRKVVAISMTDIRNRYREAKELGPDDDLGTIRIRATVAIRHPDYLTRHNENQEENETTPDAEPNVEEPTQQEDPAPDQQEDTPAPEDTLHENIRTELQTVLPNNIPNTVTDPTLVQAMRNDFVYMQSALLTIAADAETPIVKTSTATVYVNAENREIEVTETTRFRNFRIGSVVHLQGVGKTANLNDNESNNTPVRTVYPIKVYELMLSDLVACGAITIEDAILLGPMASTRENLETNFNKASAAITDNRTLLSIFQDTNNTNTNLRTNINGTFARKILAQVISKTPLYNNDICRDAWQAASGRTRDGRYNSYMECPPGEYFLDFYPRTGWTNNKKGEAVVPSPKYRVQVSQRMSASTIYTYPGKGATDSNRTGIAFHNGGSTNAVGCITFNQAFSYHGNTGFNAIIYVSESNEDSNANRRRLTILCSDERNAIQPEASVNDHRYYDLVDTGGNTT